MFDIQAPIAARSKEAELKAKARQDQLTKPPGSLGFLEEIAIRFAGWQGTASPQLERVSLRIFAADHGVCARGISAFPQEVTRQMISNFCSGGAAISVLSREQGFDFAVWNMGTVEPMPDLPGLLNLQIAPGTRDVCQHEAMTGEQLTACLHAGWDSVPEDAELFIGGEMGIGNTTSAAALMAALYGLGGADVAGAGTGLDAEGVQHKAITIDTALARHCDPDTAPGDLLQRLGGLEIAALAGAYLGAAHKGVPSLVDGFISSVALAYASALNPAVLDWVLFSHCSAEQAHRMLLEKLEGRAFLNLDMRLGEASGASVAVPLIRLALALHSGMATFAEAGVSQGQ